jgi:hypothetical protein
MLRFLIGLAAIAAVLATPAHAQKGRAGDQGPSPEQMDKKMQEQALDAQYRSTLKRMKSNPAPARPDPWANTRETDAQKR